VVDDAVAADDDDDAALPVDVAAAAAAQRDGRSRRRRRLVELGSRSRSGYLNDLVKSSLQRSVIDDGDSCVTE